MVNANAQPARSKASIWLQAARPFSFSASIIPVLVGGMIALNEFHGEIKWFLFPITLLCAVLFHSGSNIVSEYFDLKKGVDRKETFGSSRVLVEELLPPKTALKGGIICFATGFLLGLTLVYFRGWEVLLLGLIGFMAAYFYTASPVGFKYFALGDLGVFTMFGPLMVLGTYYSLTGTYNQDVIWISLPVGFLVIAILHANNTRDILHDSFAHIKTYAMIVGVRAAQITYYSLVIGAYLAVVVMVIIRLLEPWALIVFLSIPPAIKNMKEMSTAQKDKPELIAMLDVKTAQHHMLFGLLLTLGLLLSALI